MSSTLEHDPRVIAEQGGVRGLAREYQRRLASGDIGQLPVLVGLVVIGVIFQYASHGVFLNADNLVNLTLQMAAVGTIAVGIVLVLLLGEIDLSVGAVSGVCAGVMAVAAVRYDQPQPVAVGLGVLTGALIGAIHGVWIVRSGLPAFVVTLAGLLTWQGGLLQVLGKTGTVNIPDPSFITNLTGTFFSGAESYAIAAVFVVYAVLGPLLGQRKRRAAGLTVPPVTVIVLRAVVIAAFAFAATFELNRDRGISSGLLFFIAAIIAMDYMLRRMRLGRMIYAIGGNAEAARRAGMPVRRVRATVFILASAFAAWGGILGASRLHAVNQSAGQGNVLINAIAAAVVGGTSLFGGRGSAWAALLGIMVIQSISNGMDLLSLPAGAKFMITGGVLLLTVTIDSVLRRSKSPTGR